MPPSAARDLSHERTSVVLVVDDNVELAENVAEVLSTLDGTTVECSLAESGRTALAAARRHGDATELLVVDRRLPDIDGLELVAKIREHCPLAEAVIITGDADLQGVVEAVGRGAFAYLLKPFEPADLVRTASAALARVALVREREALRHELEESERRHRDIVEAVPAFVLALDARGEIRLWNRRLEDATGFMRDEMLGKPGRELIGNGGDRRLPTRQGGHRLVRWQLAEVESAGPTTYAVGIDVTDERSMQRRTLMAERLAAVGTLAAGLAHEVRNPLNSATLQLQVLRRRLDRGATEPEALLPVVEVVHDEIRRLDRLVTDFLAFARPRALDLQPCELSDLVRAVAHQISPEAHATSTHVELAIDPAAGVIEVDPERLRQVMLNLVRNSLEAMGEGGTLTLRVLPADAEGFVTLQVEDTGPGLAEDAPIFDAFYTTKASGTGLGLAIVHRIVQEHGGTVLFESRPGRTVFSVRLPQHVRRPV
jgi:signal transduction histidine kinase